MARPPLPCPYPSQLLLPHLSCSVTYDRTWTGWLCHSPASRRRPRYHSAAACTLKRCASQWLERPRLLNQPILPPQNTGTTRNTPPIALTASPPPITVAAYDAWSPAAGAADQPTLCRPGCRSKSAGSSSWVGWAMEGENPGLRRVLGPIGGRERSPGASGSRGPLVSHIARIVPVTMVVSGNAPECSQHHFCSIAIYSSPKIDQFCALPKTSLP